MFRNCALVKTTGVFLSLLSIVACSDVPSEKEIENLIVSESDLFGVTTRNVGVTVGVVATASYNQEVSRNELLSYLIFDGYIIMEEAIKEGSPSPKPEGASFYGARGDTDWLYTASYSELSIADKLSPYIAENQKPGVRSTRVAAMVARQPGGQSIPSLEVKYEPIEIWTAVLPIYETDFGEIIRQKDTSDISAQCDISVEYTVMRGLTEFGEAAPKSIRNFKETEELSACLSKYDDGWRLKL